MMKGRPTVAVITTIHHNVGDDFVRQGIIYLLKKKLGETDVALIHKHIPVTVRPEFEWIYDTGLTRVLNKFWGGGLHLSRLIDALPLNRTTDKILNCDLLVQGGAPVYWCHKNGRGSHDNEWYKPLVKRRYLAIRHPALFANIGAGSCQPYYSNGSEFLRNIRCASYIRELHSLCAVTTVRESLSKRILNSLDLDAPLIPCPSIFAKDHFDIQPHTPEYIALNFMSRGGHYDLGQRIDKEKWEKTFTSFFGEIKARYPVVLVCHNRKEFVLAGRMIPDARRYIASSSRDYLEFYSRARFFLGCRVHGALAVASFGRPAFVVGADTRSQMVDEVGLRRSFVMEVDVETLWGAYHDLEGECSTYAETFSAIRNKAFDDYTSALGPISLTLGDLAALNPKVARETNEA
jgi:hypothetical protein